MPSEQSEGGGTFLRENSDHFVQRSSLCLFLTDLFSYDSHTIYFTH